MLYVVTQPAWVRHDEHVHVDFAVSTAAQRPIVP